MKKSVTLMFFACFFCIYLLTCGISQGAENVIKLDFSATLPPQSSASQVLADFGKEIEKQTSGRIKVTYHPGGTLLPPNQTFDGVINGIADMGFSGTGSTAGRFPVMEVLDLPLGLKDCITGARLMKDLYIKFKPKEFDKVKVLFFMSTSPVVIHTVKPVKTLEDLKGMKIRTSGGLNVKVVEALGAVPVVMNSGDTYDALSKGVVNGVQFAFAGIGDMHWNDVVKYSTINVRSSSLNNGYLVMNKDKWNSLTPDLQHIIDKLADEYGAKLTKTWDQYEEDNRVALKAKGQTIINLSKEEEDRWYNRVAPLIDQYAKDKNAKGLPGTEIVAFCQEWIKKNQK
jgi:TRAP-type C4-dicarboxylate transport system substrate-binding protein